VLWFGRFEGAGPERDTALMVGRSVLVREGERTSDGHVLDVLPEQVEGLALSPDGRWLALRATLADGREAVLRMDLGAAAPLPGCTPDAPELSLAAGVVAPDRRLRIVLTGRGTAVLAQARLWVGTELPGAPAPCGRATPQGDLLLAEPRLLDAPGRPMGGARVVFELRAPPGPWERPLVLQALTIEASGAVRLSRALRLSAAAHGTAPRAPTPNDRP